MNDLPASRDEGYKTGRRKQKMDVMTKVKIIFWVFFALALVFGTLGVVHSPAAVGPALASAFFSGAVFEVIKEREQ